jgi:hypothetical protein
VKPAQKYPQNCPLGSIEKLTVLHIVIALLMAELSRSGPFGAILGVGGGFRAGKTRPPSPRASSPLIEVQFLQPDYSAFAAFEFGFVFIAQFLWVSVDSLAPVVDLAAIAMVRICRASKGGRPLYRHTQQTEIHRWRCASDFDRMISMITENEFIDAVIEEALEMGYSVEASRNGRQIDFGNKKLHEKHLRDLYPTILTDGEDVAAVIDRIAPGRPCTHRPMKDIIAKIIDD